MQTKVPFISFLMEILLSWIKHLAGFLALVCAYQNKEWEKKKKEEKQKKKWFKDSHVFLSLLDVTGCLDLSVY